MAGAGKPDQSWRELLLIDDCDRHILETHNITYGLDKPGSNYRRVRIYLPGESRKLTLSRVIMQPSAGQVVDHISGDTLDHRRANLRVCSPRDNARNRKAASDYKGIHPVKVVRWAASIGCAGKTIYLGTFPSKKEAALAYDRAAREIHGEFAALNYPNVGEIGAARRNASATSIGEATLDCGADVFDLHSTRNTPDE